MTMTNTEPLDLAAIEARVEKADSWLDAHTNAHSGRKGDVRAYVQDVPALIAEVRRLREARTTCAWCDLDSLGVALHNDGATYPSCGQHGQDFRQETR